MKRIASALGMVAVVALLWFVILTPTVSAPQPSFGATNAVQTIGGFPYFLAGSGISSSGTSITLTSLTLPQTGYKILTTDLGQPFYVTIEPGSTSRQEFASCTTVTQNTNNTATLSGCVRGLMPIAPYTTNSQYAFSHSGGTTLIFSNSPQFYQQFLALGNVATSTNTLIFGSTTPPQYDADPVWANFSTKILADVSYVNSVVAGGAANASETVKGIIQLATGAQAASSTSLGSTAARLAIGANLATDTPNTATRGSKVLMSNMGGFLNQNWLDLTAPFTTSGAWTFANAVSIAASNSFKLTLNTVAYVFPSSQGTAGSRLQNDGSGNLSWVTGTLNKYTLAYSGSITANNSTATTSNMVVPANVLTASSTISFIGSAIDSASASCTYNIRDSLGNTYFSFNTATVPSGNIWQTTFQGLIWLYAANSSSSFGTFQSLTGGTVNAIQAGQNGAGNGSATTNLSTGVTFVGVVQANNGANCQFSNLVMTINP